MKALLYKLLRKSEKYTKTDMVYLAKGGFWLTLGQIVSSIASFLLAIAFANLLPKETYGTYKYILSILAILSITTLPGMGVAITQAVARGYDKSLSSALKLKIRWGLLGALASLGIATYYWLNHNETLSISFLIVAIFLPFMDTFNVYINFLEGKKNFRISTKFRIIIRILATSIMVATLFITNNIFIILLSYLLSYTVLRFIFVKITLNKYVNNTTSDLSAMSYGKHLSLMSILNLIAGQLDKILIFHYLGAAPMAIYAIAMAMPEEIKGVLRNIQSLALPKFAAQPEQEIKKTILSKIIKFTSLIAVFVVIYILIAPYVFEIFFPQYLESITYSQIFAISLISASANLPLAALQSKKAKKALYIYNACTAILHIILLVVMMYFWGLMGAILAKVIYRYLNFFLIYFIFQKNIDTTASDLPLQTE